MAFEEAKAVNLIKQVLDGLWAFVWCSVAVVGMLIFLFVFALLNVPFVLGRIVCESCLPCDGWPHTKERRWPWKYSLFSIYNDFRPLTAKDWKYIGFMFSIGVGIIGIVVLFINF